MSKRTYLRQHRTFAAAKREADRFTAQGIKARAYDDGMSCYVAVTFER